jgi:hypothetical protein
MTSTLSQLLGRRSRGPDEATNRFRAAADRVMAAEVRLGWLRALNLQGSGGLAKLGSLSPVLAAAFVGHHQTGTLMAIYLLAQRVFWVSTGWSTSVWTRRACAGRWPDASSSSTSLRRR